MLKLILRFIPRRYFGDWTEEADVPVNSRPFEPSTSGSSNLQLLANAESLVAQMAQDAASSTQAEDSSSFFRLGPHRQSRKNKNKIDKEANELEEFNNLPDLNREVELRRVRIASSPQKPSSSLLQPPETKSKDLSPGLTRADLARKISISLKNKKVKRRYTERPTVNDIRIMYDHSEAVVYSKPIDADKDSAKIESVSVQTTKAAPEARSAGRREPVLEIKRYPAYNFVDTTIKLNSAQSFKKVSSIESVENLPDALPHAYSTMSLLPHTKSKPRAFESRERMEDWLPPSRRDIRPEVVDGGRSDEDVFHSVGVDLSSRSPPTSAAVDSRFHTIGSPYRNKRFSETDVLKYVQGVEDSNTDFGDDFQPDNTHNYDVVIRGPEGRRYYVLMTDQPSLLFEKSKRGKLRSKQSRDIPKPPKRYMERLSVDQLMMARMDRASSLCVEEGDAGTSPDDIELRRIPSLQLSPLDTCVMTDV